MAKASDKGQNKYGNTENLCGCHIQDFFFFFMKCLLLRGVYLGSYKLPDVQKTSRNLQMPHEKTCHFKVYIPLGRERLVFSRYLNNASCKNLYAFSNSLTSAVIHYLVLGFIQR